MFSAVFLTCFGGAAKADLACTIGENVSLNILPAGCEALLINGPIHFTSVLASNGDLHNVEFDTVQLFGFSNNSNTVDVYLQGTDTDVTAQTSAAFSSVTANVFFQTNPNNTSYSADTGASSYNIVHLIDGVGNGGTFKLNLGDNNGGHAAETSTVSSSANDTTAPGSYTVSSFFDIFTELSLNGGTSYTVADDDFSGINVGPGAQLELMNLTPEPASLSLLAAGMAGLLFARRRLS
jgi:hypothetical protein